LGFNLAFARGDTEGSQNSNQSERGNPAFWTTIINSINEIHWREKIKNSEISCGRFAGNGKE
jgi:hypothetical protein